MRLLTLLLCFFTTSLLFAGNFTVATVDMQKLFKQYPGTPPAQKKFKDYTRKKEQDLANAQKILKDFQRELDGAKGTLSPEVRKKREKEFADEAQNYQNEKNDIQQELEDKESEMTQTLVGQIKGIVGEVAQKEGVDLVLDTNDTVGISDDLDLTDTVLKNFSTLKIKADDSDLDN